MNDQENLGTDRYLAYQFERPNQLNQNPPPLPPPPPPVFYQPNTTSIQVVKSGEGVVVDLRNPCQFCHQHAPTVANREHGCATFAWAVALFAVTGCCCFWIPFVVDDCKDEKIRCGNCSNIRVINKSNMCIKC